MREITAGQYYPSNSVVHRLDPRVKLLLTTAYIVMMVVFVKTIVMYLAIAVLLFVLVKVSKLPFFTALRSLRTIIILIAFTAAINMFFYNPEASDKLLVDFYFIQIYLQGIIRAVMLCLRVVLLLFGCSILTLTTTPVDLTDGLESLLAPLKAIRFPVHELALIMSIALKMIPGLVEETDKIVSAQKARGADFESGNIIKKAKSMLPVLVPLFVSSFRRADELALAMDSRCYQGSKGRTKYKKLSLHLRDLFAALIFLAVFSAAMIIHYNWFGWGVVAMFI